ncbi:MAG TPA: ATP-binding protein [Longimicrobium sp.]|nr:ATP-binding protein [Longimicrobium sp.]
MTPPRRRRTRHQTQIFLLALMAGLPGVALSALLLWQGGYDSGVQWTAAVLVGGGWLLAAWMVRERAIRPLQTLSNLLAALREGDFSLRARGARPDDALGLALVEANALGETLREQRIGAIEATALLRRVMAEIDVAVFAIDEGGRVRLANRAGERLLDRPPERLLGFPAEELQLTDLLEGETPRTVEHAFPGGVGRWEVRRGPFRQGGRSHQLLVVADVSRVLREEERQAWRRLIRVLSHEINNSLAPIQSIAGTLQGMVGEDAVPGELGDDLRGGLAIIAGRSTSLSRFMAEYARLARLPPPSLRPIDVGLRVRHTAELERRLSVRVVPGDDLQVSADPDQLDQLLINLVRNATDAALETGGGVRVGWGPDGDGVEVWVEDDGPGLADTANLFVPFFTTKRNGTGIGLALSRQIAEAHGGTLTLENRVDARGCIARLVLPG